jgi:sigma-B regulation protein RsbU (phosphoserine phosphatase)
LQPTNIFESLTPGEIESITSRLVTRMLSPGEILMREGDHLQYLYLLMDGQVEIIKSLGTADERILGTRDPGILLGEMSLFEGQRKHTASVRALTSITVFQMSHSEFETLLRQNPTVMYELLRQNSLRLSQSENTTIQDLREKNRQLTLAYEQLKAAQAQLVEKERLEREMEIARDIQRSILPARLPEVAGYDFGALMMPARAIGGDFYDLLDLGADRLGIVLGDVSDKGVPAALVMSMTQMLVRVEASRDPSPYQLVTQVNRHLIQFGSSKMFVTLLYGILDCRNGSFSYVRAGHPPPIICSEKSLPHSVDHTQGQLLGILDDPVFDEEQVTLNKGEALLIYSDGITEAVNAADKPFGETGLTQKLAEWPNASSQEVAQRIYQAVLEYSEPLPHQDDITLVCMRRK